MLSLLRSRFGIPGVISVIALVFAMVGGAYAAKKYVITSTGQIKPSVLKSLKGQAGAAGQAGAPGTAGAKGDKGTDGTNGTNGVSVTSAPASIAECAEGGTKFTAANGTSKACNGEEGSPWLAGGTLPSEATETGVWGDPFGGTAGKHNYPISFTLPLAQAPQPILVKWNQEQVANKCPGRGPNGNSPMAEPGFACVYVMGEEFNISNAPPPSFTGAFVLSGTEWEIEPGASAVGTTLGVICSGVCQFSGIWAVTAQ
jgi:hypothetical protein